LKLVKVGDDESPSYHIKVSDAWWRVLVRVPEKGVESLLLYCHILGWHEADRFVDRANTAKTIQKYNKM
jgi:hypothetical protein